jgi:Coenzyme PQQ synthesis protein D (PqqD)
MKGTHAPDKPLARADRLIVRELPDELLIYDLDREKAHCLNRAAALVWQNCDGRTGVAELARKLSRETSAPADEQLVWYALKQLKRDHLLAEDVTLPAHASGMTRRQMIRAFGIGAAVALPLITTILAPTPAQANTCFGTGVDCTGSEQCCSHICNVDGKCA